MVEAMDENVGRIITTLDSLKLSENTLLIFSSDNGGVARISSQQPLRYGKGSYYEGGIRVPLIVSWPGKIKPNSKSDVPVSNIDFYPTLIEAARINEPVSEILDGKSLMPLLLGENEFDSLRPIFWHFPIYLQSTNDQFKDGRDMYFRTRPGSAVRTGKWKLHEYFEDGAIELYNLEVDPGEQNNLAEKYPEIVKKLLQSLLEWRTETKAPVPNELNPYYEKE
jgi:arylsulfatase A-like enzyme